ncbi:MAG: LysM peptidoglycan-binding domain-containing protein, partial [Clostridia bacterium]|nr:LysM peptidoglycan-binding domain-containing protein [Clostridia bacterium]
RYHTTVEAIERANPHLDPYNLQPGMVICIPEHRHGDAGREGEERPPS